MKFKALKAFTAAVLILALLAAPAAFADSVTEVETYVLGHFYDLCGLPRVTGSEEVVSDFLYSWALSRGYDAVQDDALNVIAEVPATAGLENEPLVILMSHMDMDYVTADGSEPDVTSATVRTRIDNAFLKTDRTTALGACGGIGVSLAMCAAEGHASHGPLRIVFTTGGESGMTGLRALDASVFENAEYLISLDGAKEREADYLLEDSALLALAQETYRPIFRGESLTALKDDTGEFEICAAANPELDAIRLGATVEYTGTADEKLETITVAYVWYLLSALLPKI